MEFVQDGTIGKDTSLASTFCAISMGKRPMKKKNKSRVLPSKITIMLMLVLYTHGFSFVQASMSFSSSKSTNGIVRDCFIPRRKLSRPSRRSAISHISSPFRVPRGGEISQRDTKMDNEMQADIAAQEKKRNPRLFFMIRLLFITYYGSLGALMPYLPVYYHSLGHSGQAIGLLGAVKPLTTFFVAPLWGIISDYTQKPSLVLQFTFIMSLCLQLLLPLRDNVNYLVTMVFLTALFNAPVKSLIDSMVMDKLDENSRGEYGKLRLYGQLGFGLGSSMVGTLISRSASQSQPTAAAAAPSTEKIMKGAMELTMEAGASAASSEEMTKTAALTLSALLSSSIEKLSSITGYKLAFLGYGFLSIPAFLCMKAFRRLDADESVQNVEIKKETTRDVSKESSGARILQGVNMLIHSGDAMLFFFLVFMVGTTSGIIENFAYVRIREVGGTGKEMGICRLVSSISGAPMFWFSGPLTEKLGADRVLVLSLVSYILRFLNYALLQNPYHALPAEALRGVTFAAFWSTGTVFAHKISPPGMKATMLLFMNAMYGGLGQSVGAIIGGKLQSKVGTVHTFLYAALVDFIFVSFVTVYLSVRKESSFKNPKQIALPPTRERKCQ